MCAPEHFAVTYAINPWMDPKRWSRDNCALTAASRKEWGHLHRVMQGLGAEIELVPAVPGLPDLVFTANAAVVLDGKALARSPCRAPSGRAALASRVRTLKDRGLISSVNRLPTVIVLEGAGDCVWDPTRNHFWMGYGQRSGADARAPSSNTSSA
jgi:N-dimethylarginine dimethylaminohydrolase